MHNDASWRALLGRAFDYSGLFPPAQLELPPVLANYRSYQASPDAWALGRLVVPAARLADLSSLLGSTPQPGPAIGVAAVLGLDAAAGLEAVREFNRLNRHARVESLEAKGTDATSTDAVLAVIPSDWPRYVEIPFGDAGERALERLARARACAKIRTGGLTQEAFPDPDALLAFLEAAVRLGLPFKATAGLHHPLRGSYRLTYEANPPKGVMFGYLNLLLATALLREGSTTPEARKALLEQEDAAITADPGGLTWRDHRFTTEHLRMMRDELFHGFGSCSFREPMDELAAAWG